MHIADGNGLKFAILDVEASALGRGSYPIEVGLALIGGANQRMRTWSSLIRPSDDWLAGGVWSQQSQAVHGISLEELRDAGVPAEAVAQDLNSILRQVRAVATDAPRYDQDWLDTLFSAAGCEQEFVLRDFDALTGGLDGDQYRQLRHLLNRSRAPHRAGPDALRLAAALFEAHRGYPPVVEKLVWPAEAEVEGQARSQSSPDEPRRE